MLSVRIGDDRGGIGYELVRWVWEQKGGERPRPEELPVPSMSPPTTPHGTGEAGMGERISAVVVHQDPNDRLNNRVVFDGTKALETIEAPRQGQGDKDVCCIRVRNWCRDGNRIFVSVPDINGISNSPSFTSREARDLNEARDEQEFCFFRIALRSKRDAPEGETFVNVTVKQEPKPGETGCGGTFNFRLPVRIPPPLPNSGANPPPTRGSGAPMGGPISAIVVHHDPKEPLNERVVFDGTTALETIEAPRMGQGMQNVCCVRVRNWCPDGNRIFVSVPDINGVTNSPEFTSREARDLNEARDDRGSCLFRIALRSKRNTPEGETFVNVTVRQDPKPGETDCGGTFNFRLLVRIPPPAQLRDAAASEPGRNGLSGPLKTFAGIYTTTLGPMTIRAEGDRASGVLPNSGLAFNAQISGNLLRGAYRDRVNTGALILELAEGQPKFHGLLVPGKARLNPPFGVAFSGSAVKSGNPSENVEPPRAKSSTITFQAPQRWVRPGDTFQVPIWMLNGNGVGALNLKLHYDPAVIQPVPPPIRGNLISGGAQAEVNLKPNNESGVAYLGFYSSRGLQAPPVGTLAVMNFRAVGREADQTPLRLEVTTLNMGDGSQPSHGQIDGVVYLGRPMTGPTPGTPPPIPHAPPQASGGAGNPGGGTDGPGHGPTGGTGRPGHGPTGGTGRPGHGPTGGPGHGPTGSGVAPAVPVVQAGAASRQRVREGSSRHPSRLSLRKPMATRSTP